MDALTQYQQSARDPRKDELLEISRRVLIDEGYAAYSMRTVAKRAGIHLKSLQYHFPMKRGLLLATVDHALDQYYLVPMALLEASEDRAPAEALREAVQFLVRDLRQPESVSFFFEMWAFALRDADARLALVRSYSRYLSLIARLIERADLEIDGKEARVKAAMLVSQIEGLGVLFTHGPEIFSQSGDLDDNAVDRILAAVDARY